MPVIYSDNEIARLLAERKPLPSGWRESARLRPKRGHAEREMEIVGADGGEFQGALDCMLADANFEIPHSDQLGLL